MYGFLKRRFLIKRASSAVRVVFKFAVLGSLSGFCCANTILTYQPEPKTYLPVFQVPESAFHAWESADLEARKIVEAWKTLPVTVPWTQIQLNLHIKHKVSPTRAARGLALVHVAMHDALGLSIRQNLDTKLAVSMAAAQVIAYLYNAEEKSLDRISFALAAQLTGTKPDALPEGAISALALGERVGRTVVQYGDTDGAQKGWNGLRLQYYGEGRYYGPGTWEPTPPYFYYPPDEPFAPSWRSWVLSPASEFRPTPPAYGSVKYLQDTQEVLSISAALTPDQIKTARFWVDGHGSVTPAGHWNQIAIEEVRQAKLDDQRTSRLFALLNIAMADTFIAVWDAKYYYWTARPITSSKLIFGTEFKPLLLTPPFPSYVSGHAGFSGCAARVLGSFFPQRSQDLNIMAEEAAHSRLLGGIHFRHDNDDGLTLGRKVADKVIKSFEK